VKTESHQGFWICQNCKNGEMVLCQQKLSYPPINVYRCDRCYAFFEVRQADNKFSVTEGWVEIEN
jgi:hypothetical protein